MSDLKTYLSIGNCCAAQWLDARRLVFVRSDADGQSIVRFDVETGSSETLYTTQEKIWRLYTGGGQIGRAHV